MNTLKTALMWAAGLIASTSFFIPAYAHAENGTITIDQNSIIQQYGDWTLRTPRATVNGGKSTHSRTIHMTESGKYLLNVDPPSEARVEISVFEEDTRTIFTSEEVVNLSLDAEKNYRILIDYEYDGIIHMNSEPQGAPFTITSPENISFSGVTPATFYELPPAAFSAQFGLLEGCQSPSPQRRNSAKRVTFFGKYNCNMPVVAQVLTPEPKEPEAPDFGGVTLSFTSNKTETLPGDDVVYRITVRNDGKHTQRNLTVAMPINGEAMTILKTLPLKGTVEENVAIWNIDTLYAGKRWNVEFPVRTTENASRGMYVDVTTRVSGPDVIADLSTITDTVRVGVAYVPVTGYAMDIAFVLFTLIASLGGIALQQRKQQA